MRAGHCGVITRSGQTRWFSRDSLSPRCDVTVRPQHTRSAAKGSRGSLLSSGGAAARHQHTRSAVEGSRGSLFPRGEAAARHQHTRPSQSRTCQSGLCEVAPGGPPRPPHLPVVACSGAPFERHRRHHRQTEGNTADRRQPPGDRRQPSPPEGGKIARQRGHRGTRRPLPGRLPWPTCPSRPWQNSYPSR